jgi:hypothetical protein
VGNEGLREAAEHCKGCEGCVLENYRMSWSVECVRDDEGVLTAKE